MRRLLLVLACLAFLLAPVRAGPDGTPGKRPGEKGFFTSAELARIDEGLTLLNMDRKDIRFDKLILSDDWRLPVVNETLSHPLKTPEVAMRWADLAKKAPEEILAAAGKELALQVTMPAREPGVSVFDQAEALARQAVAKLKPDELETLRRWGYWQMLHEESKDSLVKKPADDLDPKAMLALAAKVDRAKYLEAAILVLRNLPKTVEAAKAMKDVVVGTAGDDVHDLSKNPPVLLIDPGGNDRYIAPARATLDHPLSIVIDLGGNDVYGDGESLCGGAGLFGVGILIDRGHGDDRYFGGHCSLGCGVFGVGVLMDDGGSDLYRCKDCGEGAGGWGVGLLLDSGEGNDFFHADLYGEGFAFVGGLGLLHDANGNDVYDAGGVHLHYPLFNDRFESLSQGFAIGMRPYASGGVALLVDDSGNDRYCCDIYGQGASYWFSYGALIDRSGNDTYNLGLYGQGGGIHLSVGCLLDLAGEDLYYDMHGVGQGGAHDFAVGMLVDRGGNDYYAGSGGSQGGALTNSFALLLDDGGDDGYSAVGADATEGGGSMARGMGSIGLLVDMGGKDMYGTRERNGSTWTQQTYGCGIDVATPPPAAAPPPNRPHISHEEAEARVKKAAFADGHWDVEKLWGIAKQWAVGEMADEVPVAIQHLVEQGEPGLEKALSKVGVRGNGLERIAVESTLRKFGMKAAPGLRKLLSAADPYKRADAASFLADIGDKEAVPGIVKLLEDEKTKRYALAALAKLGAKDQWKAVAALFDDEKQLTQVTAIRCIENLHATDAIPALEKKLAEKEVFTVRFAAEDTLVSFGEAAVKSLTALAGETKDVIERRHVLRALGRIADPSSLRLLTEAAADPDWRIRYTAVAALQCYLGAARPVADRAADALRERRIRETDPHVRTRLNVVRSYSGATD